MFVEERWNVGSKSFVHGFVMSGSGYAMFWFVQRSRAQAVEVEGHGSDEGPTSKGVEGHESDTGHESDGGHEIEEDADATAPFGFQ